MSQFFSAVVTPRGIFWCEKWSHSTVRDRLGITHDFVDIEYNRARGLEVHEPIRLPEWFELEKVAEQVVELYKAIEQAMKAYNEAIEPAWKAYNEAIEPSRKAYDEVRERAWEAYNEAIKPALKAYSEAREPAWKAYNEAREPAWKAYNEVRERALKAYNEKLATVEGYVPPRAEEK